MNDVAQFIVGFAELVFMVFAYFFPTFVARWRGMPNVNGIFLVNLLLGWLCGIGWIIALVMACGQRHEPA